jgi:hypothetical protein
MGLTIDFFILGLNHPAVDAWFRGMYNSFFEALEECGCHVTYSNAKPNENADVLVVPMGGGQDKSSAQAMQTFGGPVILYVGAADEWFRRGFLERWRDRILFTYGLDASEFSPRMYAQLDISYYHLPFASNPAIMRSLGLPKLLDVVFVGNAGSGNGRHNYAEPLMRAARSRKVLFIGPGWERYGFPSQSIAWGELLNMVYNLAQICVNISNDQEKLGIDRRLDGNNRLFDLAIAGCFQVSNAPQVVRPYFDEREVVAVDPPDEWVSAIMYYLDHPAETEPFRVAARKRGLAEHTWQHRAKEFVEMIEAHLPAWQQSRSISSRWREMARLRDTTLPPYGVREGMAKLQRRIRRGLGQVF